MTGGRWFSPLACEPWGLDSGQQHGRKSRVTQEVCPTQTSLCCTGNQGLCTVCQASMLLAELQPQKYTRSRWEMTSKRNTRNGRFEVCEVYGSHQEATMTTSFSQLFPKAMGKLNIDYNCSSISTFPQEKEKKPPEFKQSYKMRKSKQ